MTTFDDIAKASEKVGYAQAYLDIMEHLISIHAMDAARAVQSLAIAKGITKRKEAA